MHTINKFLCQLSCYKVNILYKEYEEKTSLSIHQHLLQLVRLRIFLTQKTNTQTYNSTNQCWQSLYMLVVWVVLRHKVFLRLEAELQFVFMQTFYNLRALNVFSFQVNLHKVNKVQFFFSDFLIYGSQIVPALFGLNQLMFCRLYDVCVSQHAVPCPSVCILYHP